MKKLLCLVFILLSNYTYSKIFEYSDKDFYIILNIAQNNTQYIDFSINMKWNSNSLISSSVRAKLISEEEIDEDSNTGESYLSREYWGVLDLQCEIGIRLDSEKEERIYLKNVDCPNIEFDLSSKMLSAK
ncbi:hypothetical protein [Aggregatibacter actinomycetemcomitans]|uniref:hypothetical protein n=1 Tax=Aggregatibacter actinomycetemcomitans TaxID=714 RepID=UPI00197C2DF4|nr:hypothetical protein [Aggregatibacter actinomycetemcomitans]MBN6062746.1 hypothetical protein [Aggregatibacter actinomycetemcomitans]MBN6081093.1 hypothetical protein [Aggregatibacter actinomycetemcomitans]MBN6083976.1 hypothetical protein [Aggregatibacter actinomycetemcomitans]